MGRGITIPRFVGWLVFAATFALPIAAQSEPRSVTTGFLPSKHGFAFRNSFPGYPPPFDDIEPLEDLPDIPSSYGLCGGMCFAAADYFAAGKPIPRDNKPPASGSALHDYLFERQFDSFGDVGETVIRFLIWMANDDEEEDGVWYDTYEEMQTVVEQLDNGHPVVLGLVVAGGDDESDIWDNHQVLAYGYTKPSADELIVNIYDPNYPKRDEIRLHFNRVVVGDDEDEQIYGLQGNEVVAASTVRKFRGAFVIDYEGR